MFDPKSDSKKSGAIEEALTEPFPINVLCNFISPYKGDRETLTAFLTNCQNALDLASANQKLLLFKYIIARLEGKAQVACANKVFDNFQSLKSFLKQNFGETKHYNHLLLDLQSCKQQSNENVTQFALRIESCLTDLQSEIHNSESLKKDLSGRIAMTEDLALYTFTLGLHPRLGNNVRCRSPKTLNEAINVAMEEEKIQNLLFKTTSSVSTSSLRPKCRICGKPGHSDFECPNKQRRVFPRNISDSQNPSTSYQNTSSQVFCKYCKHTGHDISQCRKRKYNNERNRTFNSHNNNQAAHHVSFELPSQETSPIHDHASYDNADNAGEFDKQYEHLNL